jgi:type VI secretion system protein VasD
MKMSWSVIAKTVVLIFVVVGLTSCAMFNRQGQYAQVRMQAAQYLNPDVTGNPSPLVVTIYQLKKPFSFQQASYSALAQNSASVLGNDLVDKKVVEIRPGDHENVNQVLAQNTKYLGIVAAYRNIDQAMWRKVIKVPTTKNSVVNLNLESQGLTASLAKRSQGWFGL